MCVPETASHTIQTLAPEAPHWIDVGPELLVRLVVFLQLSRTEYVEI
jgi:hypothetical protein